MENTYGKIANDFAQKDVKYLGENKNIVLFSCVVDDDGMSMFVVIDKRTNEPCWTNGMEAKWMNDMSEIMSALPDDEESEAMGVMGLED